MTQIPPPPPGYTYAPGYEPLAPQPQYAPTQPVQQYGSWQPLAPKKPTTAIFWVFFAIVQVIMLIIVVALAAHRPDPYQCATLGQADCANQQNGWLGAIVIWIPIDLLFSTYYGFRHFRR